MMKHLKGSLAFSLMFWLSTVVMFEPVNPSPMLRANLDDLEEEQPDLRSDQHGNRSGSGEEKKEEENVEVEDKDDDVDSVAEFEDSHNDGSMDGGVDEEDKNNDVEREVEYENKDMGWDVEIEDRANDGEKEEEVENNHNDVDTNIVIEDDPKDVDGDENVDTDMEVEVNVEVEDKHVGTEDEDRHSGADKNMDYEDDNVMPRQELQPRFRQCFSMSVQQCESALFRNGALPNKPMTLLPSENLVQASTGQADHATSEVHQLNPLIELGCSEQLNFFACILYAPPCFDTPTPSIALPCRSLCLTVLSNCTADMDYFDYPWPAELHCDQFPHENDVNQPCISNDTQLINIQTSSDKLEDKN